MSQSMGEVPACSAKRRDKVRLLIPTCFASRFFPLSRRHSQGDLYDQQRGGTASLAAQDYQNARSFSPRGVSAEVAISGDPPGVQEVDHAGEQLEPSLELLHRALARAHAQAGQVGIMHLSSFLRGEAREGEVPLPLQPIPKNHRNPKNKAWSFTQKTGQNPGG
jgi:hypothetical protein